MTIEYVLHGESAGSARDQSGTRRPSGAYSHVTRQKIEQWNTFATGVQSYDRCHSLKLGHCYYPVFIDTDFKDRVDVEITRGAVKFCGVHGSSLQFEFEGDYHIYMNTEAYVASGSIYTTVDSADTRDEIVTLASLIFGPPEWYLSLRAFREDGALRRVVEMRSV